MGRREDWLVSIIQLVERERENKYISLSPLTQNDTNTLRCAQFVLKAADNLASGQTTGGSVKSSLDDPAVECCRHPLFASFSPSTLECDNQPQLCIYIFKCNDDW